MLKVLILTGISHHHRTGLYNAVVDRVSVLINNNIDVNLISIIEHDSFLLQWFKKLLGKNNNYESFKEESFNEGSVNIKYLHIRKTSISLLLSLLFPKLNYYLVARRVNKTLSDIDIDIVHAHWVYPHGFIAYYISEFRKIPYVVTGHGSDIHTYPKTSNKKFELTKLVLENSYFNFFVSGALETEMKILFPDINTKSCITYNGVPFVKMFKGEVKDSLQIGYVGNLLHVKGADRLIDIFRELRTLHGNCEFHIVGDGFFRKQLETQANSSGVNVTFYGKLQRDKTLEIINDLDLVIIPSREEGLGIVAIESLSMGTKVVGTQVGGLVEVLGPLKLTCEYKDNDGYINFAQCCSEVIKRDISDSTLMSFSKKFDLEQSVLKEINIYRGILRNKI